jgi:hypothetical protein
MSPCPMALEQLQECHVAEREQAAAVAWQAFEYLDGTLGERHAVFAARLHPDCRDRPFPRLEIDLIRRCAEDLAGPHRRQNQEFERLGR